MVEKIIGAELRWTTGGKQNWLQGTNITATELYVELLGFGYAQDNSLLRNYATSMKNYR